MLSTFRQIGLGLLALAAVLLLTPDAAWAKRLALVLGNSRYQNAPVLGNPANDAQDLAQALRGLGFEVIEQHDAGRDAMARAVRDFADRLPGAEVALFYYAGHGLQMNGENYLLPVDASIRSPADVRFGSISLSDVQGEMEAVGHVSVIILDACRDNPFTATLTQGGRGVASRGLRRTETAAQGSLIVYSTQPNSIALDGAGRNSPFTAALLKNVATPGLEIRQMVSRVRGDVLATTDSRQTPWDSSSLVGDVYLASAPAGTTPPAAQAQTPATQAPVAVAKAGNPPHQFTPPAAAPAPDANTETECEKLAAYHIGSMTAAQKEGATDWTHATAVCQAEVEAHPGDPRFVYALGRAQDHLKNYAEALRDFRAAAEAGHIDAAAELGRMYYFGHGVLQSYPLAFQYFNKAAAAGSLRALANVAAMYGNGEGVLKDDAKSLDLAEMAVEAGNPEALRIMATAYFNGHGVPRDYKMAGQYYQQMVDLGDGRSMKFLANMYESGYLGSPDPAKASELRLQAARVDPDSPDPMPAHLPLLRQAPSSPPVQRRRYVVYRPTYLQSPFVSQPMVGGFGQPMVGGIFKAPGPGATCCPPSSLVCPMPLKPC